MCIVMWLVGSTTGCVNKCSQVSNFLIGTRKTALHSVLSRIYALSSVKFLLKLFYRLQEVDYLRLELLLLGGKAFRAQGSSSLYVWLVGW